MIWGKKVVRFARYSGASVALAGAVLASGVAFAADLPSRKAPPIAVAPAPIMTWTGFYAGLNAGYGWSADPSTRLTGGNAFVNPGLAGAFVNVPLAAALSASGVAPASRGGFIGGGQVGFNYQMSPSLLVGLEADIQGVFAGSSNGSIVNAIPIAAPPGPAGRLDISNIATTSKLGYLATVRGRFGLLATPSLLVYATGGLAFGQASASAAIVQTVTNPPGPPIQPTFGAASTSATRLGWALGAGGEWKFAANWSAKLEYLYYDLGSLTNNVVLTQFGPPGPALQSITVSQARTRLNGHVVRAGLNYHFNCCSAAPVVAKY
ncbi:MAG: porin family protein [Rhodoblastus sp.]|nr:porin family protein [Rhodoblastus sp.]MCB1523228.1 porin family protein [Rhodoblastus sp.]